MNGYWDRVAIHKTKEEKAVVTTFLGGAVLKYNEDKKFRGGGVFVKVK